MKSVSLESIAKPFPRYWSPANHGQSHYPQTERTENSADPSVVGQKYSKSATRAHLGGHSRTQNIIYAEGLVFAEEHH